MATKKPSHIIALLDAFVRIDNAADRCIAARNRLNDLIAACEEHEKGHRSHPLGRGVPTRYRLSVRDVAKCFAARAVIEAPPVPPRDWKGLDVRSDMILGAIVARYLREGGWTSLRVDREAAEAFDYSRDCAVVLP